MSDDTKNSRAQSGPSPCSPAATSAGDADHRSSSPDDSVRIHGVTKSGTRYSTYASEDTPPEFFEALEQITDAVRRIWEQKE